jgi:hypothetical protein
MADDEISKSLADRSAGGSLVRIVTPSHLKGILRLI